MNPREVAMIIVNGTNYTEWENVMVHVEFPGIFRMFRFSVSEQDPAVKRFADLQIKPQDKCEVYLGGELAVSGYVYERQTYYDANRHGVQIAGQSLPGDTVRSSVMEEGGQFNNQNLLQIAKKLYKPYGINVVTKGDTSGMMLQFDDAQVQPGESPFHMLERLARARAVWIGDNASGDLVLFGGMQGEQGGGAALVEGENIQWARITIDDLELVQHGTVLSQGNGTDDVWGRDVSSPQAEFNMKFNRYKPYKMQLERGASNSKIMQELQLRARYERNWRAGTYIIAEIGVQGWFKPNGGLWEATPVDQQPVFVHSPMAMIDDMLAVKKVTWTQDNENGTMTTLELVDPSHYNGQGIQFD